MRKAQHFHINLGTVAGVIFKKKFNLHWANTSMLEKIVCIFLFNMSTLCLTKCLNE